MQPTRMPFALVVVSLACVGVGSFGCAETPIESASTSTDTDTGDGDGDGDPGDGDGDPGDGDGDPGDGDPGDGDPGDGDGEPGDGDGDAGDGDPGDGDGDGDPGDGDGDGDPAECGNGEVEGDEVCDDGNDVDEDDCTNACALPACGDGIVSDGAGEACDDGNTSSGDGCTANCVLPGALIDEAIIDIGNQGNPTEDVAHEVVIDSGNNIAMLIQVGGVGPRLVEYDPDLAPVWNFGALVNVNPTLAIGPMDELVIGGRVGNQGSTRKYDSNGNHVWTSNIPVANSWILSVAVDGQGNVRSAGVEPGGGNNDALIQRYDSVGATGWSVVQDNGGWYGPITANAVGQSWAIRDTPQLLENFAANGTPGWVSEPLPDADYHELAADADDNVYVLASATDESLFSLHKFDDTGALVWTADHDTPNLSEQASGLTLLPGGAILVAGFVNDGMTSSDGLLVWYDADGDVLHELVIDGMAMDDLEYFHDVAAAPGGDHAVAVGRQGAGAAGDLWIYKFEI